MFPAAVFRSRLVVREDGSCGVVAQYVGLADEDGFRPIAGRIDDPGLGDNLHIGFWLSRGTTGRATAQQQNR